MAAKRTSARTAHSNAVANVTEPEGSTGSGSGVTAGSVPAVARTFAAAKSKATTTARVAEKTAKAGKAVATTKKPVKKPAAKTEPVKKSTAKPAATKEPTAKKPAAKKAPVKKSSEKASPAKAAAAKKSPARPAASKKSAPAAKAASTGKKAASTGKKAASTGKKAATAKKGADPTTRPAKTVTATKVASTSTEFDTAAGEEAATTPAPSKKAAARKKISGGRLAVRDGETPWTAKQVAGVRSTLEHDASRLHVEIASAEAEINTLLREGGEGAGNDQADVGSNTFERDHEMSMVKNARENLELVEAAIARIDAGTYGICESCEEPIGKMRLQAFPRATLCMQCKQREERR